MRTVRVGNMLSDYALCGQFLRNLRSLVGGAWIRGGPIREELPVVHRPRAGRIVDQLIDGDFSQLLDGRHVEG